MISKAGDFSFIESAPETSNGKTDGELGVGRIVNGSGSTTNSMEIATDK